MDLSSKDYDRIRVASSRRKARTAGGARSAVGGGSHGGSGATDTGVKTRACAWAGCKEEGEYRAPQGRGKEGQFHWFCLDHVREYNKSYNYFDGMTDDDVIAYQRDALTGHRPTRPIGVRGGGKGGGKRRSGHQWNGSYEDPFGLFGDGQNFEEKSQAPPRRQPKGPERQALEVMGLPDTASKDAIKARYKTLVKRHHPDANQGDRSSEDRLRSVINAYGVLRRAGYC